MGLIMKEDAIVYLWRYISRNGNTVHINEARKFLSAQGFNNEAIDYAINTLHRLYFLEYTSDEKGDGYILRKIELLESPLGNLPCLGCEHLHECHIGGDRYSPERCQYFEEWMNRLRMRKP